MKEFKILNPMQLYSKNKKDFNQELNEILTHDLFTTEDKATRLYELFCEMHNDWKKQFHIREENKKFYQ